MHNVCCYNPIPKDLIAKDPTFCSSTRNSAIFYLFLSPTITLNTPGINFFNIQYIPMHIPTHSKGAKR